jgi:uncharacterized damage-inducible protein DinB
MTKTVSFIEQLFQHHLWANVRLFEACAALSEAQLDAKIVGTYGSIRETLTHIVTAERNYLHRITTGQSRPKTDDTWTMAALLESIRKSGEGLIVAAPKVQANDAVSIHWQDGTSHDVPLTILLTQAINHATEHRAQIMATLTQIGVEPPSLDAWTYFGEG